jgi:DNA-binding transcriptional ArsR family regulator
MTYHSSNLDTLFQSLADPTRRAILTRLAQGPASVTDLAAPFDMALPSFMAHLHKLQDGGLITSSKDGRVRTCALCPGALTPVRDWMAEQRLLWEGRLDRLEDYLATLPKGSDS